MLSRNLIELALTWGTGLVLLSAALLLLQPAWRRRAARRRIERRIGWMGTQQLRNVLIDDGMEGKVFVERLLLTTEGVRVLVQNWRNGNIFGGHNIDVWAQVVDKRTRRFPNPLYGVIDVVASLRAHVPGVPVFGDVLFAGDCDFPKGKPENVITLDDLPGGAPDVDDQVLVSATAAAAWEKLSAMAEPVTNPVLLGDEGEGGGQGGRIGAAAASFVAALVWIAWRLWTMRAAPHL